MTPLKRLLGYFAPYKGTIIIGMTCVLMTNVVKMTGPLVTGHAIDDLKAGVDQTKLLKYGGLLIGIALTMGIFLFTQRRLLINMSRHIEYDLRNDFYSHLQKLPLSFYQTNRTGDLMARATNDLSAVRMIVGPALMYSMNTVFATVLIIPLMASISWRLTLLSFLSMPFVAAATQYFSKRIHDRFEKVQENFGNVSNRAQESFAGVRVIRAYAQEEAQIDAFTGTNRDFVKTNMRLIKLSAVFHPILQFFIGIGFIAVLWYGGGLVVKGEITIGKFTQFTLYVNFLVWPMIALGWVINIFQRGMASMGRMHSIMEIEPAIQDRRALEPHHVEGEIEFRDLTFAYPGTTEPALKNVNLRIAPGQVVAFVGRVGSGKSTLMNLIPRLLDAEPGQVLIDGLPIRDISLHDLRSAIGYVTQETFLFSETIAGNIAFGVDSGTPEQVDAAANEAGIADEIKEFPAGYETIVGERGITLSGGQKQRSTIARALLRRPSILILDDALSAVDTYTEERILGHLRRAMRGRTSLVVSHRVSTVRDADLIVVLDNGEIAERGTHDELVAYRGLYNELHERQLLEEELAAS